MTLGQPDSVNLPDGPADQDTAPESGAASRSEQKVSWLELFFDLIFVVAFDQLALRLGDSPTVENVAEFALMFTAVWWAWAGNTLFAARYGNESRTYRWGTLIQLVSLAMIALTLRGDVKDTGLAFALAFGFNRLIQLFMYLHIARTHPPASPFAQHMSVAFGLSGTLWLGSAWLPGGSTAQILAWCAALGLEILVPVLTRSESARSLPHEEHLPERVGLLQIIALGAIVTEIVVGSRQQALTVASLVPALAAIITAVALWRLYFDQARSLPLLGAHMEGRVGRLLAWLYVHLPFTLSVVMLGVGLGHGLSSVDAKKDAVNQQFVAWPLAGALLTLAFLRWNSLRAAHRQSGDRSFLSLILGALLCAVLAALDLDTRQLHLCVAALTVLLALVVATDPNTRRLGELEEEVSDQLEDASSGNTSSGDLSSGNASHVDGSTTIGADRPPQGVAEGTTDRTTGRTSSRVE